MLATTGSTGAGAAAFCVVVSAAGGTAGVAALGGAGVAALGGEGGAAPAGGAGLVAAGGKGVTALGSVAGGLAEAAGCSAAATDSAPTALETANARARPPAIMTATKDRPCILHSPEPGEVNPGRLQPPLRSAAAKRQLEPFVSRTMQIGVFQPISLFYQHRVRLRKGRRRASLCNAVDNFPPPACPLGLLRGWTRRVP